MFRRGPFFTLRGWRIVPGSSSEAPRVSNATLSSSAEITSTIASPIWTCRRGLKTLDVREYKPMGIPMETRFYQRYTSNPVKQSGVQFLTHYENYRRWRIHRDYIDYMHWGREQGQARLPHRHQRVAFDFHDTLQPTKATFSPALFASQDPSMREHPDMSDSFDPNKKVFSNPEHWNRMISRRRPGDGEIRVSEFGTASLLKDLASYTDTKTESYFKAENRAPNHGLVPGVNQPFLGESDQNMMQAMSTPLNRSQTITSNEGRFSKILYLNNAARHQVLSGDLAASLNKHLDRATTALHSKLVVLQAAQSGLTDFFCKGVDFERIGHLGKMAARRLAEAAALREVKTTSLDTVEKLKAEKKMHQLVEEADRYTATLDELLRENAALLWRVFTAPRPLMTLVNGKCRGVGCGVALLAKYCTTRDSSEFIFDGPNVGLTPYGAVTHFLARPETSLKFPGLAEFVMLTGTSLFAGDVLKLGWTDLFSSLPGMDFHIKEWFNNTEHMHNDAIAWQLGHLLESTCKLKDTAMTSAIERCAVTPTRARWIEDAFADQPSVAAILKTLSDMESLPLSSPHNTADTATGVPFTLVSVAQGLQQLRGDNMHYSLDAWDTTPLSNDGSAGDSMVPTQVADVFCSYVLERRGSVNVVVNSNREKLRKWREQRYAEYKAVEAARDAPRLRHVFVRLEGCEGKRVEFEHIFDRAAAVAALGPNASEMETSSATVDALKARINQALGFDASRSLVIGWYLPTLDNCPLLNDAELRDVLHFDPGVESPSHPTRHPPLYLLAKRPEMYLSEWAHAVKHQLLLQSPTALLATHQLLTEVRGGSAEQATEEKLSSMSETIAKEFKYLRRMVVREEFLNVGQYVDRSPEFWASQREKKDQLHHSSDASTTLDAMPLRGKLACFEDVFESNVEIDGHRFDVRPRWSPRTLGEVSEATLAALAAPLSFEPDRTTELDVPTFTSKRDFIVGMTSDAGVEIVAGLGEKDSNGAARVAPLQSNAKVPENVNFYEMARHPWMDTPTSWRLDGFTKGSQEYFQKQYEAAQQAVYDAKGTGQYNYWPDKAALDGNTAAAEEALLNDRFYSAFKRGEQKVESWARDLRQQAQTGTLANRLEIATQDEKIYDDEYYRWFIRPGVHPNPSGLLYGKKKAGSAAASRSETEVSAEELSDALHSFSAMDEEAMALSLGETPAPDLDSAEGLDESAVQGDSL